MSILNFGGKYPKFLDLDDSIQNDPTTSLVSVFCTGAPLENPQSSWKSGPGKSGKNEFSSYAQINQQLNRNKGKKKGQ